MNFVSDSGVILVGFAPSRRQLRSEQHLLSLHCANHLSVTLLFIWASFFFYFLLFLQSGVLSALVCFKVPTLIIFYLSLIHHSLLLVVLFLLCTEDGFGGVYLVLITNSYLQSFGDQRDFKRGVSVSCRNRHTSRRTTHSRAWPKLMRGENSNEEHQCRM